MNETQATELKDALRREFAETRLDYGYYSTDYGGHYLVNINDQLKPAQFRRAQRIAEEHGAVFAQFAYEDWVPWNSGNADEGGYWDKRTRLVLVDPDDPIPFFDYDRGQKREALVQIDSDNR